MIVVCHVVHFVFGHCVGCPSVIVVCHVVYFVFLSLCRLSFCDRCFSCCLFCFFGHCVGCPVIVVCPVVYFVFLVIV